MSLYILVVLFRGGCYFPILVFEEFLSGSLMVFLENAHKLEAQKSFCLHFSANSNCQLCLALLFSLRRFHLASLRVSLVLSVSSSVNFFSASFLMFNSSIRDSSQAVNQSGLVVIVSSAVSLVASMTWLSKSCSSSSSVDSIAVLVSHLMFGTLYTSVAWSLSMLSSFLLTLIV
jgi:hypothetical protein